jgi:hypothetical protein
LTIENRATIAVPVWLGDGVKVNYNKLGKALARARASSG